MCRIMVMNLGSTSFKFKIYEMGETEACIASGSMESIGSRGRCTVETGEKKKQRECACATHLEAAEVCFASLKELGLELDFAGLDAVGYKAVHGGSISGARIVDGEVLAEMRRMCSLAPAHNPVYLKMMETMGSLHPELRQIACFETAFHATVPPERYLYGVPLEWVERYGIRRYGFHGSSHSYIAWKMAQESPGARRLISIHLGGSCSLCAIREGKSIANSMGATPQSGIFHNNRVGDLDVFCLPMLADQLGGTETVMRILAEESGLKGLSGVSNDMRAVEREAAEGNRRACLALETFADGIVGYVGMFTAFLGGLDAICFTGGIGVNDPLVRKMVTDRLGFVGARLEKSRNAALREGRLDAEDSRIEIWAFETNEELMVARACREILQK